MASGLDSTRGAEALNYRASLTTGKRVELETIRQSKGGVSFDVPL